VDKARCELPMDWARRQFGACALGDKRRTNRVVKLGAMMARNSGGSLPVQMGSMAALKAAYRLLAEPDVTHWGLCSAHWEATRHRARTPGSGPVLFIQDGTELDYTSHPETKGLGFIGNGRGQGLELQTTLCVLPSEEPEVLGVAFSHAWARGQVPHKGHETRPERDARHKETDVWGDCVEAIGRAPEASSGTRWVSVSDRGSDIFSFLTRVRALGWVSLVRSKHDRLVEDSDETAGRLHVLARGLQVGASMSLDLRARPGKAARTALLNIAWAPLTLLAPTRTVGEPIPAWCVRVWEDAEGEPLEWILVSTDPVTCEEDARRVIEWYHHRWLVEEYHKCLKTGCNMEKRQVSTKQSLMALLGILGIVSVFLLQMKSRANPVPISESLKEALKALSKRRLADDDSRAYLREIAMLGGFLGRKSDGEPGWQTIWKGWNRLHDIALGMEIAQTGKCG
jgi:hypothetical protein